MEVVGKIKVIGAELQVSATFKKRELVVVTDEQYPQSILIEFAQDKCSILDKYSVGQDVTVGINLRGREWVNPQGETKYFNQIQGWNIKLSDKSQQSPEPNNQKFETVTVLNEEPADDLPF
jgi:hypothetical protein